MEKACKFLLQIRRILLLCRPWTAKRERCKPLLRSLMEISLTALPDRV